jgi:hypothetical protein
LKAEQKPADAAVAVSPTQEAVKAPAEAEDPVAPKETIAERREAAVTPVPIKTSMEDQSSLRMKETADAANPKESTPLSPSKSPKGGNVKSWLKAKFAKRGSKGEKTSPTEDKKDQGFVGGAAYTGASIKNESTNSLGAKSSSMRDVALASTGKEKEKEVAITPPPAVEGPAGRTSDVSSVSNLYRGDTDDNDEFQEAKDHFEDLEPPQPKFPVEKNHSPHRDSKFVEEI